MGLLVSHLDDYLGGMLVTVKLSVLSFTVALAIGLALATCRVSPVPPLRLLGAGYVFVIRNVPLPVHFVVVFFGLPKVGVAFSPFTSAVIALAGYTGAFLTEAIRSGLNGVPAGQAEAARALGLGFGQVLGSVVLPQALRSVVQPVGTLFIALVKNSSVAFSISVAEITGVAKTLGNDLADYPGAFAGAACAYLLLTVPAGWVVGVLERRYAVLR